ncbi:NACHT and WD repeat domain-containing protein [Streptomyces sp. JJ36]|uniref:NACHT and WD repeat domain-containing protein n=1 Tax=Streptomyces sp. JJ36 TaxID=2736645 RepID=UPI001F2714DB|nr:NACHT and WD repeat domain-containing protein [Streptomyces sp. JJ36]MCF6525927.1 hypothetical protein [Streptomyces sp. JJ36]
MPSQQRSDERWFVLAGEGEYPEATGFGRLEDVPSELNMMRTALGGLGLREVPRPGRGEIRLHELRDTLHRWMSGLPVPEEGSRSARTLFVYCTGHGYQEAGGPWGLALPGHRPGKPELLTPETIASVVLPHREPDESPPPVDQVMLVLDACFSEPGSAAGIQAFASRATASPLDFDAWVIATARRAQEADQLAFARAFRDALARTRGGDGFLEPRRLVAALNRGLGSAGAQQVVEAATGSRTCRVLPDPAHMPGTAPGWLDAPGLRAWGHLARGRSRRTDPGWYFTGREDEQRALARYLDGEGPAGALVVRGPQGAGKSALLGRLALTGHREWRRLLPPLLHREGLPLPDDSVHALVNADGLTLGELVARVGEALGLEPGAVPDADALCSVLEQLPRTTLLIDDLHAAADPAEIVEELLDPLTEYAGASVVCTARPGPQDAVWGEFALRVLPLAADPEGVRSYVARRLRHAPERPHPPGTPAADAGADAVGAACHGHFGAAVAAMDAYLHPQRNDRLQAALTAAGKQLRRAYQDQLGTGGRPASWARDLLHPLLAASACGHEGLRTADWAALASARDASGGRYGPQDAEEAAALLGPAVTDTAAGTGRPAAWRLAFPEVPELVGSAFAGTVRDRLLPGGEEVRWAEADPAAAALFADAAAPFPGEYGAAFASPAFWAALPAGAVRRRLHDCPRPALEAALRSLPAGLARAERAFALKTALARAGSPAAHRIDPRRFGAAADVLWAHRHDEVVSADLLAAVQGTDDGDAAGEAGSTGEAGSAGPGGPAAFLFSAHGDASLRLWDLADGSALGVLERPRGDGIATRLAPAVVCGEPVAAVTVDGAGLLWRPRSPGTAERRPELDGADAYALHHDGSLAVAAGAAITVGTWAAPGSPGRVLRTRHPVRDLGFAAADGALRLLTATARGITSRPVDAASPDAPGESLLLPAVGAPAFSPGGRCVAVLDGDGRLYVWEPLRDTPGVRVNAVHEGTVAVATSDTSVAVATGGRRPALWLHPLPGRRRPGPPLGRLPLPEPPLALAFTADGHRLAVADSRGLFCLDTRPLPGPPGDPSEEA